MSTWIEMIPLAVLEQGHLLFEQRFIEAHAGTISIHEYPLFPVSAFQTHSSPTHPAPRPC
jgi:hypothetical protein